MRGQQLPGAVPGRRLPVPLALHLLPRVGRHHQADGRRAQEHQPQDDRGPVQVQLGQEAVQPDPGQDHVGQRGRPHHPRPPLADQETPHAQESGTSG